MEKSSRLPGFYAHSVQDRAQQIGEWAGLDDTELALLRDRGLEADRADLMIENVVGTHSLPLGIAANFLINGRDYLIPMAIFSLLPPVVSTTSSRCEARATDMPLSMVAV